MIFLLLIFSFLSASYTVFANEEYGYERRSNRFEGLKGIKRGAKDLRLLSFVTYREPLSLSDSPELRIRFFLLQPSEVYITAIQIRDQGDSYYYMNPVQTTWGSGWQEFHSWPTNEVLKPLEISFQVPSFHGMAHPSSIR